MIDITFEINGKKVSPQNMKNSLEAGVFQSVKNSVSKSVGHINCPVHGKKPSIKVTGKNLDSLLFEVSGCCDVLIDEVKRKLK